MKENKVYVFGANLAGRHGRGCALTAVKHYGAVYGRGNGIQGSSYAIPTKDYDIKTLPLDDIKDFVNEFILFANTHPELIFEVTNIGCGLAGYKPEQIAPMFKDSPSNCKFSSEFKSILDTLK
jgi:hypothetical protein